MGLTLKRAAAALLAVWFLFLGSRWLYLAWLPPEDHVRRRVASMAEGFNRARLGPCLSGFAPDFGASAAGPGRGDVSRELLKAGLVRLFLQAKDPVTRGFRYRVEVPAHEIEVRLADASERRAHVELLARFFERRGDEASLCWEVLFSGDMRDDPAEGWRFTSGEYETLRGEIPLP